MPIPPEKSRSTGFSERVFWMALAIGWVVLAAAGLLYARSKNIPGWAAFPLLAAFLVEYPFYLVLAFPTLRERFAGRNLPLFVIVSAVLPFLLVCLGPAEFQWVALTRLVALAAAIGLWYKVLPASPLTDVAFLALFPAVLLGGYLEIVYIPRGLLKGELKFLGHFTLTVMAIMVLMVGRGMRETGFGFIPTRREWRIGAMHFACFAVIGFPLGFALNVVRLRGPAPVWSMAGTFLLYLIGFLWVAALSEEFLVRGVLQQWIENWTWNRTLALVITSAVFGAVHLGFRGFPNWRFALMAGVLGLFCGLARNRAGGIRAGVVTHALAVATLRGFFAS